MNLGLFRPFLTEYDVSRIVEKCGVISSNVEFCQEMSKVVVGGDLYLFHFCFTCQKKCSKINKLEVYFY